MKSHILRVGDLFSIPIRRDPDIFCFGLVVKESSAKMLFSDIYSYQNDSGEFSDEIMKSSVLIPELLMVGTGVRQGRWNIVKRTRLESRELTKRYYIIGIENNRRVCDMNKEFPERPASEKDIELFPPLEVPFPQVTERLVREAFGVRNENN